MLVRRRGKYFVFTGGLDAPNLLGGPNKGYRYDDGRRKSYTDQVDTFDVRQNCV